MNSPHSNIPRDPFHQGWIPAAAPAGAAVPIPTSPLTPAAPAQRTAPKVRWGRIALSLAGATMIALAAWTTFSARGGDVVSPSSPKGAQLSQLETSDPTAATVSGTGADLDRALQGNPNVGLPSDTTSVPSSVDSSTGTPPQKIVVPSADPVTAPAVAPMKGTAPSTDAGGGTPPMKGTVPSDPVVTGGGGPEAPEAAPSEPTTVPVTAQPTAAAPVRGGGGPAELPYTGAETWIVAILGILVLAIGVLVQINAVRIGMTAMLYRRGILLRPVDCARLAGERGLAPLRVWISNALHYLLQEPAGADFVTSR